MNGYHDEVAGRPESARILQASAQAEGKEVDRLIVRLGPDGYEDALLEPHVMEFDITGKSMKGWVLVEPEGIEGDGQLKGWIERAMKFVRTLPAK